MLIEQPIDVSFHKDWNPNAPDVLLVKAEIINLYVTAPDVMTPGRTRTYTTALVDRDKQRRERIIYEP